MRCESAELVVDSSRFNIAARRAVAVLAQQVTRAGRRRAGGQRRRQGPLCCRKRAHVWGATTDHGMVEAMAQRVFGL
jgi:hypothetical protein